MKSALPLILLCLLLLPLAACERRPQATHEDPPLAQASPGAERVNAIRQAARELPSALEVLPLRDPAVEELLSAAYRLEDVSRYRDAAAALEQARAIEPESPEVQQRLAENAFFLGDLEQAERRALEAWRRGPRLGALCLRHWLLVAEARAGLDNAAGADDARSQAEKCAVQRPARF